MQSIGDDWLFMRPGALTFSEDGSTFAVAPELVIEGFYNCCDPRDAEGPPPTCVPSRWVW